MLAWVRWLVYLIVGIVARRTGHCGKPSKLVLSVFVLCCSLALPTVAIDDTWSDVDRIVAVGDLHGDYKQFVAVLRSADLISRGGKWTGGRTHLVQLGDIPDRGPDTLKIIEHLQKLEKQARRAQGDVHVLIGNHDAMNVYGDLRFVHPGEYMAFVDDYSGEVQDRNFAAYVEFTKQKMPESEWPEFGDEYRAGWEKRYPLGRVEHEFAWKCDGVIGEWVCGHNAVIKINDTLFLHGGIGPSFAHLALGDINDRVRAELWSEDRPEPETLVRAREGPLWYRGLAQHDEEEELPHLLALLEKHQVSRIVIAHTTTAGAVIPRFGGRVILADVGLAGIYGANLACLVIEQDEVYALHRGTRLPLPADSGAGLLNYLRTAEQLDPSPSPLSKMIERLETEVASADSVTPSDDDTLIRSEGAVPLGRR